MRYFSHIPDKENDKWFTLNGFINGEQSYIVEELSEAEYNKRKEIDSRPLYYTEKPFDTHIVRRVHKYPEPNFKTYELADGQTVEIIDMPEAFYRPKPNLKLLL